MRPFDVAQMMGEAPIIRCLTLQDYHYPEFEIDQEEFNRVRLTSLYDITVVGDSFINYTLA